MLAVRPVLWNVVPDVTVPMTTVGVQLAPVHRRIVYFVTPTLSVETSQNRLIWLADIGVALRLLGTVGGVVSFWARVVASIGVDLALSLPCASRALTANR